MTTLGHDEAEVERRTGDQSWRTAVAPGPTGTRRCRELDPHLVGGHLAATVPVAPAPGDHTELSDVSDAVGGGPFGPDRVGDVLPVGPHLHQPRSEERAQAHRR